MAYDLLSEDDTRAAAFALVEASRYVLVISVSPDGKTPKTRLMSPVAHHGAIWFRTRRASAKVRQMRQRPGVEVVATVEEFAQMTRFSGSVQLFASAEPARDAGAPERFADTFDETLGEQRLLVKFTPHSVHYVDHRARRRGMAPFISG